jgi:chromosome segregation ATPase
MLALSSNSTTIIVAVITALGTGGLLIGIAALIKLRPEVGQVTVTTAEGVMKMQTELNVGLQKELQRAQGQIAEFKERLDQYDRDFAEMRSKHDSELAALRRDLESVTNERNQLRRRVKQLEDRVRELQEHDAERS